MPFSSQALSEFVALDTTITGLGYFTASNICLFYFDYFITLGDEVEYMWKRDMSFVKFCYFINRYLSFFGYIINSFAYFDPTWGINGSICKHFIKYEGSLSIAVMVLSEILVTVRVYAIYGHGKVVLFGLVAVMTAQVGYAAFLLSSKTRLALFPPPFTACISGGNHSLVDRGSDDQRRAQHANRASNTTRQHTVFFGPILDCVSVDDDDIHRNACVSRHAWHLLPNYHGHHGQPPDDQLARNCC